jgi:hypothetical protein
MNTKLIALGGAALGLLAGLGDASACGCFTPPDPSVPVVQAGERIAFAIDNGQVTAHIQIQYSGDAQDFGWLLPLPQVPTLDLGTDELFNQLIAQTQPKYKLTRVYEGNCSFNPARFGGGGGPTLNAAAPQSGAEGDTTGGPSVVVVQDSIGPYDYAVLHADSKDDMLNWLNTNHYFVPAGTDATVDAYIHPGAYFLALKLKSGKSAGDLQPVVVHYASDLPMIPIVLTSTGAKPNMGIQVWMLGAGRAIPRNYYHTVINDALLDWVNGSQNYNDVIIKASGEAPGKHTFVTEYAGTSSVMQKVLNPPGRFGDVFVLAQQPDEISFVDYLNSHGYSYTSQLLAILQSYIPMPAALANQGVQPINFYQNFSYYFGQSYRQQFPATYQGYTDNFDAGIIATDINDRVVKPTLAAGALFDKYAYLTRLYTTLSPEDMNKDPVFSYNPDLPGWPNEHEGTLTYHCGFLGNGNQANTPATLRTASGWVIAYPYGATSAATNVSATLPASERIEILREAGAPEVVQDNSSTIDHTLGASSGCGYTVGGRTDRVGFSALLLLAMVGGVMIWRRRRA